MNNKKIFICILVFVLVFQILNSFWNENFSSLNKKFNSKEKENNTNLYLTPIKNIFLGDNYNNYQLNKPEITQQTQPLTQITFDSFLYSKPTTQKIICSSHKNSANCWEDNVNNCQWVYKIDSGSYCDVAPIWLL